MNTLSSGKPDQQPEHDYFYIKNIRFNEKQ